MGSCLITKSSSSKSLDSYTILYPSQGSTIRDGMIRTGGDYEVNTVWNLGAVYNVRFYYWMHPDNYSTEQLYYGLTTSSYTQFASASAGSNIKGSYECTAQYMRCRFTAPGSGSVLLNIFALVIE